MRTKLIGFALALGTTSLTSLAADNLLITEYVEGSSNNKAIELYNPTNAPIDLSNFKLNFYFNGSTSAATQIELLGILDAQEAFVVAENNANADILAVADMTSTKSFYNGDDLITLTQNDQVIDSIGQFGVDPGSQWGSGDISTRDNTLRRITTELVADTDINDDVDLTLVWQGFERNNISDLGMFSGDGGDPTDPVDPVELTCEAETIAIHNIQGSGEQSPLNGQQVTVAGIVTANFEYQDGLQGFTLQAPESEYDADNNSSEGIFVYTGNTALNYQVSDSIILIADVAEFNGLTELTNVSAHTLCGQQALPAATTIELPFEDQQQLEAVEGMLVSFPQSLVVNEVHNLARFGEVLLGSQRHYIGTQVAMPGDAALLVTENNLKDSILLDDASTKQNPELIRYPAPNLSAGNTLRIGDSVTSLSGIIHYGFNQYRIMPINEPSFVASNPRTDSPELNEISNLKIASFNVLNYFNGDGQGNGFPTQRGADTPFELVRQQDKIVAAMAVINADVYALMEMENDGFGNDSAIAQLTANLNEMMTGAMFNYVTPTQSLGDDDIAVGVIYRSTTVEPYAPAKVLTSANSPLDAAGVPLFNDSKNRPMLVQAFTHSDSQEPIIIAVNHLKSKGSDCDSLDDPDLGDGQGNCNITRTRAAQGISEWLASEFPDQNVLLLGDLNAYAKEDPIQQLKQNGYVDIVSEFSGLDGYSFVFRGATGQLDHALATADLVDKVVDVNSWHINADEPRALDYNEEFKSATQLEQLYAADAYRSSDHDPIIVSLLMERLTVAPTVNFTYNIVQQNVAFEAQAADEDGEIVSYSWDFGDGTQGAGETVQHAYQQAGEYNVVLTVTDNDGLTAQTSQVVTIEQVGEAPVADFYFIKGSYISLFVSKSYDPDGMIKKHNWQFNDGFSSNRRMVLRLSRAANHVRLEVTDNDGQTSVKELSY
ncbi:ExeM/NucH family extracellular endonuclease [Parashewanella spongiae]|uniref:ExeM/NucH family extracellular endonuclease n=1 Tax=Parashewanella spongiae TaxID=342950 RepID=A0A3A6T748_9GAMM|nr:ExeM/NucH family extracellular endonuclease [Parashewanella spongiae]MCL1079584.1 ExeM/NucH family extracellular endonuclease [Parashewanella spongiae]RJY07277.1 ExeM/NucH family extracellular endonuclease [Parashewanella spongiae]